MVGLWISRKTKLPLGKTWSSHTLLFSWSSEAGQICIYRKVLHYWLFNEKIKTGKRLMHAGPLLYDPRALENQLALWNTRSATAVYAPGPPAVRPTRSEESAVWNTPLRLLLRSLLSNFRTLILWPLPGNARWKVDYAPEQQMTMPVLLLVMMQLN